MGSEDIKMRAEARAKLGLGLGWAGGQVDILYWIYEIFLTKANFSSKIFRFFDNLEWK